jgi:hypothetical protein
MKYMLNIYGDMSQYADATPEQSGQVMQAYEAFGREVHGSGAFVAGEGLQTPETATAVKVRDGERLVTDGPFPETKEQLGGFYLLECKDLDEAIEWAAKIPGAQSGTIEVRPVMSYE